jgi:SpoVK/Ycf46/Vps4 family AAA+-type ATPase
MEAYRGLAVLATNMKGALDQAFTRRLRFIVTFPFPGPAERELIWRQAFGKGVPIEDLDYARLAKLNLAGGSIHNVAMNATFLAAASPDQRVSMATILSAARMELRKMNRPFNEAELDAGAGDQK